MLFLIGMFFYAFNSFASDKDYFNSTTRPLVLSLYKIVFPLITIKEYPLDCLDDPAYQLHIPENVQKKLVRLIQQHFYTDAYDAEKAESFFEAYRKNYRFDKISTREIKNALTEFRGTMALYPTPKVMREQSGETDRESFVIGSYESACSFMSGHSSRSRARTDSHVSFDKK